MYPVHEGSLRPHHEHLNIMPDHKVPDGGVVGSAEGYIFAMQHGAGVTGGDKKFFQKRALRQFPGYGMLAST